MSNRGGGNGRNKRLGKHLASKVVVFKKSNGRKGKEKKRLKVNEGRVFSNKRETEKDVG